LTKSRTRPRTRTVSALALAVTLAASGCGSDGGGGGGGGDAGSPDDERTYTVGYSSTPGVGDLASLLTWDELRSEGINIDTQFFSDADVVIQALARGDIDFATNVGAVATMQAVDGGLPLEIFAGYVGAEFVLGGTTDIKTPKDLEGKTVAVHSEVSLTNAYTRALIEKHDLQDVEVIIVPNSSARAQAIEQGQVDAAPLDLADATLLASEAPDRFHTVLFFGEEFSGVENNGTVATTKFLEDNAEDAQLIVDALIQTNRKMAEDPDWAAEQSLRFLGSAYPDTPDLLQDVVRDYIDRGLWDLDGGIDKDTATATIAFNEKYAGLEGAGDDPSQYYNFDLVADALDRLGRQG
jgi:ABC-type nitrate/sulfonate/bicarbonate transport system substrate-binding protein